MEEQNIMNEKRNPRVRNSSSIIFNLVALALLLTVIVLLHQVLKKPVESQPTAIKAIPAIPVENAQVPEPSPGTPTENTAPAAAPAAAYVPAPAPSPTAAVEESQVSPEVPKKTAYVKTQYELGPQELDAEQVRQQYLEENRRASPALAKQNTSPSISVPINVQTRQESRQDSPRLVSTTSAPVVAPSRLDLDDATARQYYTEQNRRLSPGALKQGNATATQEQGDEHVRQPYEQKSPPLVSHSPSSRVAPAVHDLDDENVRTYYLEQNRELSPNLAHGNSKASPSSAR